MRIVEIARERLPTLEVVVQCFGDRRALGDKLALSEHPDVQRLRNWPASLLTNCSSLLRIQVGCFALDVVERHEEFQCLLGDLALLARMQIEEFSPRVRLIWSSR